MMYSSLFLTDRFTDLSLLLRQALVNSAEAWCLNPSPSLCKDMQDKAAIPVCSCLCLIVSLFLLKPCDLPS